MEWRKDGMTEDHDTIDTIQKSALLKISEFHFSLVSLVEFSIISSCLGKVKVFLIILPSNLVYVQRLHEKGKWG